MEVVGLIPAAGSATRLRSLPCSKELYPIGLYSSEGVKDAPKVVSHYLLEKMRAAGIVKAFIVIRAGKWDIPAYFRDGFELRMHLAYLTLKSSWGVPFTLDQAFPFVRHAIVAFGFPDILFSPTDAFSQLLARHSETQPDLVLGLCPPDRPSRCDAVRCGRNGVVEDLILEPSAPHACRYSWAAAVWSPGFTEFLHHYVRRNASVAAEAFELTAGHAIRSGIRAGLTVESVVLSEEPYLDIGTPEGLAMAAKRGAEGFLE